MQTIELIGPGVPVPQLEVAPASALVSVTDQVIDRLDQATWEGMASGPRDMNTNGKRIMGLVLRTTDLDILQSISNTGSEIAELAHDNGIVDLSQKVVEAYPNIVRPYRPAHDQKWGWEPREGNGEIKSDVIRCAANVIRNTGVQVIDVGLTRKINRGLMDDPDAKAPWFS